MPSVKSAPNSPRANQPGTPLPRTASDPGLRRQDSGAGPSTLAAPQGMPAARASGAAAAASTSAAAAASTSTSTAIPPGLAPLRVSLPNTPATSAAAGGDLPATPAWQHSPAAGPGTPASPAGSAAGHHVIDMPADAGLPQPAPAGGAGQPQQAPAGGAGQRVDAAALKAALAPPAGQTTLPAGQSQLDAFEAARQYQQGGRAKDLLRATTNQTLNTAVTAMATFGTGRNLANMALDATSQAINGHVDMPAPGSVAAYSAVSAVGGTATNMLAQSVAPYVSDKFLGNKMTAVPAEALVPQRTDAAGQPVPLTGAEQALRAEIKARQAELMSTGSAANTLLGGLAFTASQVVRTMAAPPPHPPAHPPAHMDLNLGKELATWGAGTAVSAGGGAVMGAAMALRQARATMSLPDPANPGQQVTMNLFQPLPTAPTLRPAWAGNAGQVGGSAGMRVLNLAVAGVPLQIGAAIAAGHGNAAVAGGAQALGMAAGASAYFQGQGLIAGVEGARARERAQAQAAAAAAAQAAQAAPQDAAPGAAHPA